MVSQQVIKKNYEIEQQLISKIKKFETDKTQIGGIINDLRYSNNYELALIKYGMYLDINYNLTRDELITKAIEIRENT